MFNTVFLLKGLRTMLCGDKDPIFIREKIKATARSARDRERKINITDFNNDPNINHIGLDCRRFILSFPVAWNVQDKQYYQGTTTHYPILGQCLPNFVYRLIHISDTLGMKIVWSPVSATKQMS